MKSEDIRMQFGSVVIAVTLIVVIFMACVWQPSRSGPSFWNSIALAGIASLFLGVLVATVSLVVRWVGERLFSRGD